MVTSLKKKKRRRKVLLVDNDQRSSYIICLMLKLNSYDIEYYADPKSMLSQLEKSAYDLILLSLSSAETNYLELYNQIRKRDAQVSICFMMDNDSRHNNYYNDDNFVQSFKGNLKSCEFVDKPVTANELLEVVKSHLKHQHE